MTPRSPSEAVVALLRDSWVLEPLLELAIKGVSVDDVASAEAAVDHCGVAGSVAGIDGWGIRVSGHDEVLILLLGEEALARVVTPLEAASTGARGDCKLVMLSLVLLGGDALVFQLLVPVSSSQLFLTPVEGILGGDAVGRILEVLASHSASPALRAALRHQEVERIDLRDDGVLDDDDLGLHWPDHGHARASFLLYIKQGGG
jgi:hypothetical protein